MYSRRKAHPRAVYLSFGQVVELLSRRIAPAARARIVWTNVPNYHPYPVPINEERKVNWIMKTVDCRGDDGSEDYTEIVHSLPEVALRIDPFTLDASSQGPENVALHPLDDDAMSNVSDLALDEDGGDTGGIPIQPVHARFFRPGRLFSTCKSFLVLSMRKLRRTGS